MVRGEYLPAEMTDGEQAALAHSDDHGWISPPVYNSANPAPAVPWKTCHLRYLQRRGLVRGFRYRRDGAFCVRVDR